MDAATLTTVERERPVPGPGEVLVRVHAAGVNPTDLRLDGEDGPDVPGFDVAGVVAATGVGVTLLEPGEAVFGMIRFPAPGRAYAQYATAPARHLTRQPPGLGHVRAAALPLAGLTAWQALHDTAGVRPGQRVLVHAAAGGVGHLAVQIAKALGAHVTGTASPGKHAFLLGLGADEAVDYAGEPPGGFDVVLDGVRGPDPARSLPLMRDGGVLVSITTPLTGELAERAAARGIRAVTMLVEPDHTGMTVLAGLAEGGMLRPELDAVLPLERAAEAHERIASGRTRGKIVLTVP
ncbi:NADPH:quinone reductase [Actinorhabdospora filicis]|uniref:NADPH:quinone reductase n=1 Tax=Actinorhabdospora filicis TaxID=1785913 RepID=A0A9W6SNN9_9ACTN|nr:NADPH:quinone reductase [Actinorhabdospora filicis]